MQKSIAQVKFLSFNCYSKFTPKLHYLQACQMIINAKLRGGSIKMNLSHLFFQDISYLLIFR